MPKSSVLGPVLFLVFINDIPDNIRSSVVAFADDLYRNIYSPSDCLILQDDLDNLACWEADWQTKFSVVKCHSMRVSRHLPDKQIKFEYTPTNKHSSRLSAKYLGITITDDFDRGQRIAEITSKVTSTLGFLRRNFSLHRDRQEAVAYKTLVQQAYVSPIWHPYVNSDSAG